MTEEHPGEPRRRRGTRGGRGRGGRAAETTATRPDAAVDAASEPRIVGRRPGRPPAATAGAEPATEALAPTPTPAAAPPQPTAIRVVPPEAPAAPRSAPPATIVVPTTAAATGPFPTVVAEAIAAPARRAPVRRAAAAATPAATLDGAQGLAAAIETLRAEVHDLAERVDRSARRPRLGVFVDVPNLLYGAERGERIDMGKLLDYLSKDREMVRATAYSPVSDNPSEPVQQQRFVAPFVPYEYRIVTKSLKRFADGSIKGNFDVEMAVDMLNMVDRIDVMAIVSGDADFARVVEEAQSRGVRVEVVAFAGSTSAEMRALADHYIEVGAIAHLLR